MLPSFSNQYLAPDDVSVPCRVRRCGKRSISHDEDGDNDEQTIIRQQLSQQPEEMTCTMRKWHRAATTSPEFFSHQRRETSDSKTKQNDAELILTPVHHTTNHGCSSAADGNTPIPLSRRFASFGGPDILHEHEEQTPTQKMPNDPIKSDIQQRTEIEHDFKEEFTIPVNSIIKIRTRGEDGGKNRNNAKRNSSKNESSSKEEHRQRRTIGIETSSFGSYELLMESTNELLVLMTFLKINATQGKVVFITKADDDDCEMTSRNTTKHNNQSSDKTNTTVGDRSANPNKTTDDHNDSIHSDDILSATMAIAPNPSNLTHDTAHTDGEKSIDVEAFTAKRMTERLKRESLTEKVERRMHRLVSSLEELSVSVTKCACACFGDSGDVLDQPISIKKERQRSVFSSRPRRNTASTVSLSETVENNDTPVMHPDSHDPSKRKDHLAELMEHAQLPSGLSVESEDHLEDLLLFQCRSPHNVPILTKASI